ncbi:MAG: T9SS type A sorting domain-containing protein [Phaeodactylibacter sp.]|uniref:T9SS type A sorting domain-containing protein n=1 Tax=Phaeodactylibacter sp. TaxID=1940289 RepID=UPI0032EFA99E
MYSRITHHASRITHPIAFTLKRQQWIRASILTVFSLLFGMMGISQTILEDSLDLVMDTTFLAGYEYPLSWVEESYVINFRTKSVAYLKVGEAQHLLENNRLKLRQEDSEEATLIMPAVTDDGYLRLELSPGRQYELLTRTTQGNWKPLKLLDTRLNTGTEMITVSEQLNEALYDWQEAGNQDLYTFLIDRPELSLYERFAFMQGFLKKGAPLSDLYAQGSIPQSAFILGPVGPGPVGPGPGGPGGGDGECSCRVLNINANNVLVPHGGEAEDQILQPVVHDRINHETHRRKIWETGRFIGPARYQQLDGTIKKNRCGDGSYSFGEELLEGPKEAVIKVRQLCRNGNWEPGDCYCTQKVTFNYRYDSDLYAFSKTKSGACFDGDPRTAYAIVQDVVGAYVTRQVNYNTAEILYDSVQTGIAYSYCEQDFNEGQILNVLKLGFEIYAAAKGLELNLSAGGQEWELADTLINQGLNIAWKEYRKTNAFSTLEKLLTEEWSENNCVTDNTEVTHRSSNSIPFDLQGDRELVFRLIAGDHLEVGGEERWRSTAALRSGFAISVLLEKNENVGQENEYCCTKPAGIYQTETFNPTISSENYREVIGGHLNDYLNCCFPIDGNGNLIIGENDRDIFIADELPNCSTTVNQGLKRKDQSNIAQSEVSIKYSTSEESLEIANLPDDKPYQLELFNVEGKRLSQGKLQGDQSVSLSTIPDRFRRGLVLVRISGQNYSLTQKIFLP